jgi:fido (protein-threonine AMPylation protein)
MTDLFEDMFDAAGALNSVDTLTGKNLSELVRALKRVEQQIEDAELQHAKALKAEKHKLSVELIPSRHGRDGCRASGR